MSDIDFRRSRIAVQRTVSGRAQLQPPKDAQTRYVVMSPALREMLRQHVEAMTLEAQVKGWDARDLVSPTEHGRLLVYRNFIRNVWRPLHKKAGIALRKYHSTRHTYATWLLEAGTDPRFVQAQLGHSSIAITCDIYGHMQPEKHESAVAALDVVLAG